MKIVWALSLTLLQILILLGAAPGESLGEKVLSCHRADSHWYASIVEKGYVSTIPPEAQNKETSNVAFFPGFPVAASLWKFVGLSTPMALLWAAWVSTFFIWFYTLGILGGLQIDRWGRGAVVVLLFCHPAGFFSVMGYSESTFLAAWLGFFYWNLQSRPFLAILHGFYGNFTRLTGLFLSGLPVLENFRKGILRSVFLASGSLCFFIYCQLKWGTWDLYQQTEAVGWGQQADFLAIFKSGTWSQWWPKMYSAFEIGKAFTAWLGLGLLVWAVMIARFKNQASLGFWIASFSVWFISVSGTYHQQLSSMMRFSLPIWFFFILGIFSLLNSRRVSISKIAYAVLGLIALWGLLNHLHFVRDITRDIWVA